MKVLVAQSCPTLCYPVDCSPPGSSVHGILRVFLPLPSLRDLPDPGIESAFLMSPALAGEFFIPRDTWEAQDIHYIIQNRLTESRCIAQGTIFNIL